MPDQLKALAHRPFLVALLLGLAAQILFTVNVERPGKIYFDEVHYVPAAQSLILAHAPRNIEHPLVAKEFIALGMGLFGDEPFGWRIMSTVAGTATVLAGFAFMWLLFGAMRPAVVAALLLMLNQFLYIQARIAMLDVFLGAFLLWALAALLWSAGAQTPAQAWRRWIAGSVLLGLAVGVKWSAIPYVAMIGLAFLLLRLGADPAKRSARAAAGLVWLIPGALLALIAVIDVRQLIKGPPPQNALPDMPPPPPPGPDTVVSGVVWPVAHAGLIVGLVLLVAMLAVWLWQGRALREKLRVTLSAGAGRWPGIAPVRGLAVMGVVSIATYLATFWPAFFYEVQPLTLANIIPFQLDMYAQQTQVLPHHTYQSDWWSWPLMVRPIWYLYEFVDDAQRGVLLVGNPVILWGGLVAVGACLWSWWKTQAIRPLAVALLWVASVAIYIVIPKSLGFFYYYHLSALFICFALATAFHQFAWARRKGLEEWFTAASLLMFVYFYPIISSAPLASGDAFNRWMWFGSWR